MKLKLYSAEQLDYLHALHARGHAVAACGKALTERWPDAHKYDVETLRGYLTSEEGAKRGKEVLQALRERALEYGYADKGSRLDLLNSRVESLSAQLRALENPQLTDEQRAAINLGTAEAPAVPVRHIAQLNKALLETMQLLQKEMDPLAGMAETVAPAVAVFQQMMKAGVSPAEQRAQIEAADKLAEKPN